MSETDWAWLAGFFDGEGCVRGRSQWRHDKATPRHTVAVSLVITQRDRWPLERVLSIAQCGTITAKTGTPTAAFHWVAGGHTQIAEVMRRMLPYSVVKREQLDVALTLLDRCQLRRGRGHRIAPDELDARMELLRTLSALKRHHLPASFAVATG